MSTSGGDTQFSFSADDADFQAAAARVSKALGKTAADGEQAGEAIDKGGKKAARGLDNAGKAARKAAPSVGRVKTAFRDTGREALTASDAIGKAGSSAAKTAGAMSLVSDAGAEAARGVADIADVGEVAADVLGAMGVGGPVAAAALAALALAAAPVVVQLSAMAREAREAAEWTAFLRDHTDDLTPALDKQEDAARRLLAATGALTPEQEAIAAAQAEGERATRDFSASLMAEEQAVNDSTASIGKWKDAIAVVASRDGPLSQIIGHVAGWNSTLEENDKKLLALNQQYNDFGVAQQGATETTIEAIKAEHERREAEERATRALDAHRETLEAMAATYDQEIERIHGLDGALDALRSTREDATTSNLEGVQAEIAASERAVQAIYDQRDAALALARTDAARLAIATATEEAIVAQRASSAERQAEIVAELQEAEAAANEKRREDYDKAAADARRSAEETARAIEEAYTAAGEGTADIFGSVSDALALAAEKMADDNRAAAEAMFAASQAAAIAQATINTAQAVTAALTVPPPAGPILAVAAGAAGAVQIATIAATEPSFHAGGVFGASMALAPDEGRAVLRDGEGVLTPETTRNMGGPSGIALINRAQGMFGGGGTLRIGREAVSEMGRIDVRSGGTQSTYARKAATRDSAGAGRSGRRPLA